MRLLELRKGVIVVGEIGDEFTEGMVVNELMERGLRGFCELGPPADADAGWFWVIFVGLRIHLIRWTG